ncbi:hypothetical protein [Exiguobacterium oxidotolerans]|uniref:hypothetical protein n=1 Tax=Exiguobacterium oxidotolerans TaxID=223958 RepID=UPI001F34915C|nr:hypothetical protein [Exiguobacterium oxidotolerans]
MIILVEEYQNKGEVTVSVQAIEELLLCAVIEFGVICTRIKRLPTEGISFSLKVTATVQQLPALYMGLREQVRLQLGDGVVDYLQLVTK